MRTLSLLTLVLASGCATDAPVDFQDVVADTGGGKADAYGRDIRVELYEAHEAVRQAARSVATVVNAHQIVDSGSGDYVIAPNKPGIDTLGQVMDSMWKPICADEKYREQPSRGRGTAFLIAPDLVATAGHVAYNSTCERLRFVFDYGYYENPSTLRDGLATVNRQPRDNIYACKHVRYDPDRRDLAIIQLDRPVTGRMVLPLVDSAELPAVGTPAAVIGSPTGLPVKFAPPGRVIFKALPAVFSTEIIVTDPNEGFFTNLGVYQGNSGSPVFGSRGVEGVLVQGDEDWVFDDRKGCYVTHVCAEDGADCKGEYALRSAHLLRMLR